MKSSQFAVLRCGRNTFSTILVGCVYFNLIATQKVTLLNVEARPQFLSQKFSVFDEEGGKPADCTREKEETTVLEEVLRGSLPVDFHKRDPFRAAWTLSDFWLLRDRRERRQGPILSHKRWIARP